MLRERCATAREPITGRENRFTRKTEKKRSGAHQGPAQQQEALVKSTQNPRWYVVLFLKEIIHVLQGTMSGQSDRAGGLIWWR